MSAMSLFLNIQVMVMPEGKLIYLSTGYLKEIERVLQKARAEGIID